MKLPRQASRVLGWLSALCFLLIFAAGLAQSFERTGTMPPIHTGYNGAMDYLIVDQGSPGDMIPQLELALQIVVNEQHIQNHNLALALQAQGQLDQAIYHYEAAIAIRSEYVPARVQLASALFSKGLVADGIVHLEHAHRLEPDNADVLVQTGLGYGKLRDLERAEGHYRQAIALDSTHPVAHFNLARVLHVRGLLNEAIPLYRRATALDPRYTPRATRYLKELGAHRP